MAAIAAGADGLIIEVHNEPRSLCDGQQSVSPAFGKPMEDVRAIAKAVGREISAAATEGENAMQTIDVHLGANSSHLHATGPSGPRAARCCARMSGRAHLHRDRPKRAGALCGPRQRAPHGGGL